MTAGTPGATTTGLPRVARFLGTVVAPTGLATGLLFYFGFMHAYWFFDYFGINSTVLGLGTVDFLMRSADALFVPLTIMACATLLGLRAHLALRTLIPATRHTRWLLPALAVLGLILAAGGLISVFTPTVLDRQVALAPFCLGGGSLLALYAFRLRREAAPAQEWIAVAEWAGVFLLVALSLFWAATDYSAAVGRTQARRYAAELAFQPDAVLYSERSLRLHGPGVRETRCQDAEAAYGYRYDGLKLVLHSGDQYVFLPAHWTRRTGAAFVVPRAASLRLEFHLSSAATLAAAC